MMIRDMMHAMGFMALLCCTALSSAAEEQLQKKVAFSSPSISAEEIRVMRRSAISSYAQKNDPEEKEAVVRDAREQLCEAKKRLENYVSDDKQEIEDEIRETEGRVAMLSKATESVRERDISRINRIKDALKDGLFDEALDMAEKIEHRTQKKQQIESIMMRREEVKEAYRATATPRTSSKIRGGLAVNRTLSTFKREFIDNTSPRTLLSNSRKMSQQGIIGEENVPAPEKTTNVQPPPTSPRGSYVNRKTLVAGLMGAATMGLCMYLLTGREHNPAATLKSLALIFDASNPEHQKKAHELLIAIDVYLQKNMAQMPDDMQQLILMLSEYIEFAKNSSLTKELLLEIAHQAVKIG